MENQTYNKPVLFFKENKIALIKIILLIICLTFLYYDVFKAMVYDWVHLPDFSHGFLVPIISLYFLWERRTKLKKLVVSPSNMGIIILGFGLFAYLIGNLASESFTMRFSFVIVLSGIILFLLGKTYFKTIIFPLLFLIFMIPIPSIIMTKITFPLQLFASRIAEMSLQLLSIPVLREGNIIVLAETTLEVAEACSGIRSLISLLALSVVFAYLTNKTLWKRSIIILSCIPIAIVVNAFRVSATGVLANYYGPGVAQGFFHDFSGYLLFIVAFVLLLGLNFLLAKLTFNKTNK